LKDVGLIVFGAMLVWVVNHFMPLVIQNGWDSYICSLTAFGARREGLEPPNRQIRRLVLSVHAVRPSAIDAAQVRCRIQPDRHSPSWQWLVD